jgi:homoserine kinase
MQQATIRVPASTSNLGPGFDCLGVALRLYNFVTIRRAKHTVQDPLIRTTGNLFFCRAKQKPFPFSILIAGDVPAARGLGGSATVRLGILHGLNVLTALPLTRLEIFELAAELEGHPDNAAPAAFGGFNVYHFGRPQHFTVSPRLKFVLLVQEFEVATIEARRLLPRQLPHRHAVDSSRGACNITAAFVSRRYENLRGAFTDYLHQPYRKKLVPFLDRVVRSGENAGALGGFLSGSGSTIICLTLANVKRVAAAMRYASGLTSARAVITTADNVGARLIRNPQSTFPNHHDLA